MNDPGLKKYWDDDEHTFRLYNKSKKKFLKLKSYEYFHKRLKDLQSKSMDYAYISFEKCLLIGEKFEQVEKCFIDST